MWFMSWVYSNKLSDKSQHKEYSNYFSAVMRYIPKPRDQGLLPFALLRNIKKARGSTEGDKKLFPRYKATSLYLKDELLLEAIEEKWHFENFLRAFLSVGWIRVLIIDFYYGLTWARIRGLEKVVQVETPQEKNNLTPLFHKIKSCVNLILEWKTFLSKIKLTHGLKRNPSQVNSS